MNDTTPGETFVSFPLTNARIIELYREYDLTRPLLGEIVGVSRARVDTWMYPPTNPNHRLCPDRLVRLLEFELGIRTPRYTIEMRTLRKASDPKGRKRR